MNETGAESGHLPADTSAGPRAADARGPLRSAVTRGPLRSAVIVNPVRVDDISARRETIESELAAAGWPAPLWLETTQDDPGAGQARHAVDAGARVVFVCGGDGTVRSCIEGLAGTDAALAVLPAGTGNLLATNLGVPDDTASGVQLAIQGGRRRIDVGDANGQAFAVMAGMGFDAALLDDASTKLKAVIGAPAYVLSALRHLRDRRMHVHITLDNDQPLPRRARTVVIGNVGRLQGGVHLLREAEPDSGHLEVAILAPHTLHQWVALAWGVLRGHRDVAHMEVLRASRITVTSNRDQPRQLDGDVINPGRTLTITVRPGALELCVPEIEMSADPTEGSFRPARDEPKS